MIQTSASERKYTENDLFIIVVLRHIEGIKISLSINESGIAYMIDTAFKLVT